MFRAAIFALALFSTPVLASSHYHAQPAVKPAAAKLIVRDTIWACGDGGCAAASKSSSRPAIICEVLVKEVGPLRSFSAGGQPLTAVQLEKCNARAN